MRSTATLRLASWLIVTALSFAFAASADAQVRRAFITGEDSGAHVVFEVEMDPAVSGSAIGNVSVAVTDPTFRLDGIDLVPGTADEFVVGAQVTVGIGGAIRHFHRSGAILADFVSDTQLAPAGGISKPSSVLSTPSHAYYIENQFGFAGAAHRILRTPFGGPPGTMAIVFDAGALPGPMGGPLFNLEGLELNEAKTRLYFFARDEAAAPLRALYSIGLTGAGLYDGLFVPKHLAGLHGVGAGDGSDELDREPGSGFLFGSNIKNGEVTCWNTAVDMPCPTPPGGVPGFLITGAQIAAATAGSALSKLGLHSIDGIRATGDGFLILTGMSPGTIFSVDIGGVYGDGADELDVKILIEDGARSFDDITPAVAAVPVYPINGP